MKRGHFNKVTGILNPYMFSSPTPVSNLWDFWEAALETGLSNNDPMGQFTGQANGRHWTQSTSGKKPLYKTNQINGLPAVDFDPTSSQFFNGPNMSALTGAHIFAVVRVDADPGPGSNGLWNLSNWDNTEFPYVDGVVYDGAFANNRWTNGNPTPSLTAWTVYEVSAINTPEWKSFINGTQLGSTHTDFSFTPPSSPKLGSCQTCGASGNYNGQFAGLYLYDDKLTTGRAAVISYINSKFGLSSS